MKLVCEIMINGVEQTKVLTTANNIDQGAFVRVRPGVGKPFLMFASLPGSVVAADFDGAPIVSADPVVNNAAITDMLANPPLDRLTFA